MANKLYAWDEIDNTIAEREPEDLFRCNAEGGWVFAGWYNSNNISDVDLGYSDPIVTVVSTGRHIGLETWAESIEEAQQRFLTNPVFQQYRGSE